MLPADEVDTNRERRHRAANLARRAKLLRFHVGMRGADGKSISAARGGRARMGDDPALARAAATEMALKRWYPIESKQGVRVIVADSCRSAPRDKKEVDPVT